MKLFLIGTGFQGFFPLSEITELRRLELPLNQAYFGSPFEFETLTFYCIIIGITIRENRRSNPEFPTDLI
jgi:hypothetical protein